MAVLAVAVAASCASSSPEVDDGAAIQDALEDAVEDVPTDGASVAVIDGSGELRVASTGFADRTDAPVGPDTRFAAASITKTFTTALALRLAEEGELVLDDPVDLEGADPRVTLRDLLGHTAGLPYPALIDAARWNVAHFQAAADAERPPCEPRDCYAYSDLGFVGAGLAIEEATGEPYEDVLERYVLDPLQLEDSEIVHLGDEPAALALPDQATDVPSGPPGPLAAVPVNTWSAGALITTSGDLARFGHALLDGQLLGDRSLAEMQAVARSARMPCVPSPCIAGEAYGLGLHRFRPNGRAAWGHTGSSGAVLAYFPETHTTIAVLTTRPESGLRILFAVMDAIPGLEQRGDIYAMDADGSNVRPLVTGPMTDGAPAPAPDGESLLFASNRDGRPDLYVTDLDGDETRRLTDDADDEFAGRWTPDGESVVFASDRSGSRDLWMLDVDDGTREQITDAPGSEDLPAVAPDGERIAFTRTTDPNDHDLAILDLDDGSIEELPEGGYDDFASWSPDGDRIVFHRGREGLWVMRPDGSDPHAITPDRPDARFPSWGPDDRIAFVSENDVWTVSPDGSDPRRLERTGAAEYSPVWTPDGRSILFTSDRR